jgi:3-polyprenyl-4-hydroxybenzoate decarboxylase
VVAEVGGLRKVGAAMWQLFLERFVPLVDDDVSALDRLDGVGASASRRKPSRDVAGAAATRGGDSAPLPLS